MTHCVLRCSLSSFLIVLSLARSTMSTTFFSSNRKVQRAHPAGGLGAGQRNQLGFLFTVKNRQHGRSRWLFRLRTASSPSSTSCWRVRQTVVRPVSQRRDFAVAPSFAIFGNVGFSAAVARSFSPSGSTRAVARFPLCSVASTYFFTEAALADMIRSRRILAAGANHAGASRLQRVPQPLPYRRG
jgi:hypothetical protein